MPSPVAQRVLVDRRVDGLLVGWLAVIVWIAVFVGSQFDLELPATIITAVFWVGTVVTAAHFGLSYHLAYSGGGAAVRRRPAALAVAPVALLLLLGVLTVATLHADARLSAQVISALVTVVYLMTTWHYVKQTYGVARVGAGFAGVRLGARDVQILRFGLYPLWFLGAARLLVSSGYSLGGYRVGYDLLPSATVRVLQAAALVAALPVAFVFARLWARRHAAPPSVLVAPYVAAFLWLGLPTAPALTILLLAPFHALQYLAVGHRAELAVAADRPGHHGPLWWLNIFAGAACGGLLLSRWLPALLDTRFGTGNELLFGAAFFVFLNLHHYVIDASIWRSNGELVSAMARRKATQASREPAAATS